MLESFSDPILSSTPEVALARAQEQQVFVEAFRVAYAELSPQQRELMRAYFVDKQTVVSLGAALGVHTSTAARRLTAARERLLDTLRRELEARQTSDGDPRALIQAMTRRLELGPDTLLRTPSDSGAKR